MHGNNEPPKKTNIWIPNFWRFNLLRNYSDFSFPVWPANIYSHSHPLWKVFGAFHPLAQQLYQRDNLRHILAWLRVEWRRLLVNLIIIPLRMATAAVLNFIECKNVQEWMMYAYNDAVHTKFGSNILNHLLDTELIVLILMGAALPTCQNVHTETLDQS